MIESIDLVIVWLWWAWVIPWPPMFFVAKYREKDEEVKCDDTTESEENYHIAHR